MLATKDGSTQCRYLAALIGLKEPTVVGKRLAYYGDRCTGIQKCSQFDRFGIFEADSTSTLDDITRIHQYDIYARAAADQL